MTCAHSLWEDLKEHERAASLFACDAHVQFTNNRALPALYAAIR